MEDGQDHNAFVIFNKEDFVWKPARQGAPDDAMDTRIMLRIPKNCVKNGVYTEKEIGAETRNPIFVPIKCLCQLCLCFGTDNEPTAHCLPLTRSRTIPHGEPSLGFW